MQDGKTGDVDWFGKSFNEELSVRLQKLNIKAPVTNTPESIESAFLSYLKACEQRRIKRLEAFTADKPEIVFTKYRTLRPSFFAYTEGVSDARAECNYIAGGALAKLKMNGIWAEVETLLTDEEGVFVIRISTSTVNTCFSPGRSPVRRMTFICMKWI